MTYGSNCSNTKVSNHGPENWLRLPQDRKGRNLRSLGTGSGALVPRVTRDTHLDCVCRRFELAIRLRGSLAAVEGSEDLGGCADFGRKLTFSNLTATSSRLGVSGRAIRTLEMTYLVVGRWSSGCSKAGSRCAINFWKMWAKVFGSTLGRCRFLALRDMHGPRSTVAGGRTPPCQPPPVPPRHSSGSSGLESGSNSELMKLEPRRLLCRFCICVIITLRSPGVKSQPSGEFASKFTVNASVQKL